MCVANIPHLTIDVLMKTK